MTPDVELAIQLQELDTQIHELEEEVARLPEHIRAIEKALDSHDRKLEADRAALSANQRERRKLEGDIQAQEQKLSKLKDQMMEARTNEQYRAFQKEIEYGQSEIRKAEDRILDLMAESEPLEQNVKAAEAALKAEKQKVEAEKVEARKRTAEDERQLSELRSRREGIVRKITPKIYAAYQRIRSKRRPPAVAEAIDGHCSACHLALRPQFFQDLRHSDQVMYCESCGRILYYTPAETLDGEPASRPSQAENPLHTGA